MKPLAPSQWARDRRELLTLDFRGPTAKEAALRRMVSREDKKKAESNWNLLKQRVTK